MILMYHNVDAEAGFNTVSKANFVEQMSFLKGSKYNIVPIEIYVDRLKIKKLLGTEIVITFDDAYDSFKSVVLPVLEDFQIPAALFIPVGFVGKYNQWDSHLTDQKLSIMSWDELKMISFNSLVTVGSHGNSHQPLSRLKKKEIIAEVNDSKKVIEAKLGVVVNYFSYPYGQYKHFNRISMDELRRAGYEAACSTNWNRFNSKSTLYKLNRIEIEPADSINDFIKKVDSKFHIKYFKQLIKNSLPII